MTTKGRRLELDEAVRLVKPRDSLLCGLVAGQAVGLLEALGARTDLEEVVVHTGLLVRPYALLTNPGVRIVSAFFGPIERMARDAGAAIDFLPADFHGLERLALRLEPRVVTAVTTPPDANGWLNFGLYAGASYRPFVQAARDPRRLAIAEVNPRMPRVPGLDELGGNRIHLSEVDAWAVNESDPIELPVEPAGAAEKTIAERVLERIPGGAVLQFGIGAIPNEIATRLAEGPLGGFGIHTEMVSDGVMRLHEAGKIANRKALHPGLSIATFALGTGSLYRWLDGNATVRMLPVSSVNDPALLREIPVLVSINGALAIDLAGQVAADHVGGRQYSGVGGHEAFVIGASEAPEGRSFLCLKSTATVDGRRISAIVRGFSNGVRVTTARHHVQWIVTEHGAADLSALPDEARAQALIELADPEFRAELSAARAR